MPRKYFRKYLPTPESIATNRYLRRLGPRLTHPNLWHVNRRSVAGGAAVGMFAGLIPGSNPVQFLAGALGALLFKVNLPVSIFVTLYSNPFTILPLYYGAYQLGKLIIGGDGEMIAPPNLTFSDLFGSTMALLGWFGALGKPLVIGLVCLAAILAVLAYFIVDLSWRAYIVLAWRRRRRLRASRSA